MNRWPQPTLTRRGHPEVVGVYQCYRCARDSLSDDDGEDRDGACRESLQEFGDGGSDTAEFSLGTVVCT